MNELFQAALPVGEQLKQRKETIAIAESSAGGLISAALLSVGGASAYYRGGGIIYTREARRELLGFSEEQVTMRGACEEYALIAARALRNKLGSSWALCETGATGPTGNRYGDAAGHVAIALVGPQEVSRVHETSLSERQVNMVEFSRLALALIEETLCD